MSQNKKYLAQKKKLEKKVAMLQKTEKLLKEGKFKIQIDSEVVLRPLGIVQPSLKEYESRTTRTILIEDPNIERLRNHLPIYKL